IKASIATTDQGNMALLACPVLSFLLCPALPLRSECHHPNRAPLSQALNRLSERIHFEDHAVTTAKSAIIHRVVGICGELAWIDGIDLEQATAPGLSQQTMITKGFNQFRKERDNTKFHSSSGDSNP